jgi:RES domain-containing protein
MFVYRVASRRYAPDNSEGARLYGGRWNNPGSAVIYSSATRSLAALEVIANNGAIPADYRVVVIELPDGLPIETVELEHLPDGWPANDSGLETAGHGSEWVSSLRTAVLEVPSAVIPDEHNYILNPQHPHFSMIGFRVPTGEYLDHRLQTK